MIKTALFAAAAAASLPAIASAQAVELLLDPASGDVIVTGNGAVSSFEFLSADEDDTTNFLPGNLPIRFGIITGFDAEGNLIQPNDEVEPTNNAFNFPTLTAPDATSIDAARQIVSDDDPGFPYDFNLFGDVNLGAFIDLTAFDSGLTDEELVAAVNAAFTFDFGDQSDNLVRVPITLIPEPATLSLAALGGVALLRRRR